MPKPTTGADDNVSTITGREPKGIAIPNESPWLTPRPARTPGEKFNPALPNQYEGMLIQAWLDYPKEIADLWTPQAGTGTDGRETSDEIADRMRDAFKRTFTAHNNWQHPITGEILPQPSEDEFWDAIPNRLVAAIYQTFQDAMSGGPTSPVSNRKTRRR